MNDQRSIEKIIRDPRRHWVGNGFYVSNYFPMGENLMERFNPFFLLDYNEPMEFKGSPSPRGVGPHPHRGLETVSFAFEGAIEHHDNQGNHGIIYPGDVQWMTAARGIMHKEYHEGQYRAKGGTFHMVQLWINLPARDKYAEPGYQAILNQEMGKVTLDSGAVRADVVAGSFQGIRGPARTFTPMNVYMVSMEPGALLTLEEPGGYNLGILFTGGSAMVGDVPVEHKDFLLFRNEEGVVEIRAGASGCRFLTLSGEPLKEPIAAGGEFVMNTREELEQAFLDRQEGRFGSTDF